MSRALAALLALLGLVTAACDGQERAAVVLDGRPRFPDQQGVVQEVDFTHLVLDGDRRYKVTRDLQCFSTYTLAAVPLLHRLGQYVQVGLDGDRVAWLASVGGVVPGDEPAVYYTGQFERVDGQRRAIFRDGTVFALGPGVEAPAKGFLQVRIDPQRHVAVELRAP